MGIITALNHITHYTYDRPISLGMQTIRLRPAPHTRSHIQSYSLKVTPSGHFINWQQDPFGNYLARIVFPKKVKELRVEVDLVLETRVFNPFDFFLEEYAQHFPFSYEPHLQEELAPYLEIKENGGLLTQYLNGIERKKTGTIDFLVNLNQNLNQALKYVVRLEPGVQSCEETLTLKSGSCRDMAWLLCQILRHLGFASRFASGYLIQLKQDVKPLQGPAGPEEDFTDLHAWTEVYLPGAGWVGLDPTSGLFAGEGHIPLCCTPNHISAAPVSGTLEICEAKLQHEMNVTRIHEEPRVTRPFTESQWKGIDALGKKVDADLKKRDVRLTMGGEPTFVSEKNRSGKEWNFTALGKEKKELGNNLLLRLREKFGKGGLLHYGQGKWYPGEELPRWAMTCHWRKDGIDLWEDDALIGIPDKSSHHNLKTAENFIKKLAASLGIPDSYIIGAFDYRHPEKPVAYIMPLHFSYSRKNWISNAWKFKDKHITLIPGDSPAGLRLPLSELPHVAAEKHEYFPERSQLKKIESLPSRDEFARAIESRAQKPSDDGAFAKDANGLIKTAVCAEVRHGTLHIFLPPTQYAEHFIELITAIEITARNLETPVILEGYSPPSDKRLSHFSITPDPGVLEVNIQPASDWEELKEITTAVYNEAHKSGLTTEKFLLDGRMVGTGGGNHIVIGAAMPEDSPFLRRPDLLKSMIIFWQNHPSLSYLFAGMYIGPTSQSPRIDEARNDSLYEMEIAFQQMEDKSKISPQMVDRLLRNLLVDLTGNTHRAEFCIDKLYSPDGNRGRLGLLEMRGFEMTAHPRMNLVQALLIRALISHFWKNPYSEKLIRWGTYLHDAFMLPYYVKQDFREVLNILKTGGYDFPIDWFEPFFTFRFPNYGTVKIGDILLELRMALEPWPVMGEELISGGVSRGVDSSVERLQVTIRGIASERYAITCNGRRLPLRPTEEKDTYVAGLRFKAWAPPSALHPKIPVHTPLVFDVIDTFYERSLGGCMYHVAHPGGRNYETFPVNANEAEGRRLSRFAAMGHTPGHSPVPAIEHNPEFPHTLDLRHNHF